MNRLRSILLLGTFATAGVALAIGLGVSVSSAPLTFPDALAFPKSVSSVRPLPEDSRAVADAMEKAARSAGTERERYADEVPTATPVGEGTAAVAAVAQPAIVHLSPTVFVEEAPPGETSLGKAPPPVAPAAPYAQQISLGAIQETLKQAVEELRRNERPIAQVAPAELGSPGLPTFSAEPLTDPDPTPVDSARIRDEGDGLLTIHIQNEDIRRVLELLGAHGGINILASPRVQGTVSATLGGVGVEEALDAILRANGYQARRDGNFVFVGTATDFIALEQSFDRIATRIFRPNYITATELQKLISPLLTEGVGVSSVSTPAESGIGADAEAAGGDSFAGAEAVVVRDYEAVLMQVDALVADVDIRPLQVHIEAMILSVTLKEGDEYGVNWQFLRDSGDLKLGVGLPPQTLAPGPIPNVATFDFEQGALKIGFLDRNLGAFLRALETVGDTSVIASPRLLVLNKQRANIQIGDQKGYITTTVTETSATETVEFLETGTILRIRPFISTDGMIRMEIHPELSKGEVREIGRHTLPDKQVTRVTSNVMVRDGSTVVIGGLMRDEVAVTKNQLPFFGNLPLVGFAFRSSTETTERQEVMVLITPHIVADPGMGYEGEKTAAEFQQRHETIGETLQPFNRRQAAQRYFRLAQSAWARGDRETALRFADRAVHFRPGDRDAIDLRNDIWQGWPCGDHALLNPPHNIMGTHPLDEPHMADWLLDELRQEPESIPAPLPGPLPPLVPGSPGYSKDISRPRKLP